MNGDGDGDNKRHWEVQLPAPSSTVSYQRLRFPRSTSSAQAANKEVDDRRNMGSIR